MVKMSIRITHVSWRDGRPRFQPAAKLRGEGWKGEDLRHGPEQRGHLTGPWYTAEECLAWSRQREAEIEQRRADVAKAKARHRKAPPAPAGRTSIAVTVGELAAKWLAENPKFQGKDVVDGKRTQRAAAPATVAFYRQKLGTLEKFDMEIWTAPADALSGPIVYDLYERLWTAKGLATAHAVIAALSACMSWGMRRGKLKLATNPCKGLQMEAPEARVRALTPAEVRQLVAAADLIGRPEIGDCVTMAVWTGQRQADRLASADLGLVDGRRVFRQIKTGAIVAIRETPELAHRLAAARGRREAWRVHPVELIVDERRRLPWDRYAYSRTFAEVRAAAVAGVNDAATGDVLLPPMPSLDDARDQDLRDTAVTWLARAGCTHMETAQITGHSMQSVQQVLKHYLASHPEISDNAIRKQVAWYEGQTS